MRSGLRVQAEGRIWVATMGGNLFMSEGLTRNGAIDALAEDLREYAEEWEEHYRDAPNHQENSDLVQLVLGMNGGELGKWLREEAPPTHM